MDGPYGTVADYLSYYFVIIGSDDLFNIGLHPTDLVNIETRNEILIRSIAE